MRSILSPHCEPPVINRKPAEVDSKASMDINVRYFGFFEDLAGCKEESFGFTRDGLRVRDVIARLSEKYGPPFRNTLINPETNQIREGCVLMLNGIKGYLDEEMKNGDSISLLPVLAGG